MNKINYLIFTILLIFTIGCGTLVDIVLSDSSSDSNYYSDEDAHYFFANSWEWLTPQERYDVCMVWITNPSEEIYEVFWSGEPVSYDQMVDFFEMVCAL